MSLIGFWEWRSALLMAFDSHHAGDDVRLYASAGDRRAAGFDRYADYRAGAPGGRSVVAGDSIKRSLAEGHPPVIAAWLGPTKLAHAILFATITNIVAYLPFLC